MAIKEIPYDKLPTMNGQDIGKSSWVLVDRDRVLGFADVTEDHQWIHVDEEKAKRESPFGGPIAHGYLTLSLVPKMFWELVDVTGCGLTVNYGINKLRFTGPTPVGSNVRLRVQLNEATANDRGVQALWGIEIEVENQDRPACAGELVFLYPHPPKS